jgi:regulatory protein YycH of two-component signal transduction system YycFG
MKLYFLILSAVLLCACGNNNPEATTAVSKAEEKPSFFPVTSYLKGQLYDIKAKGVTPIKYTTINNHTDSVMVKLDSLNALCKEFLHPEIDSVNLINFFTEAKFLDQTVDAFTFTYDAKKNIPDSIHLIHWDVYVEPETSKVRRVYITKKGDSNKILQLTWQSNQWFKIVTIASAEDGTSTIEKEEKISWDY